MPTYRVEKLEHSVTGDDGLHENAKEVRDNSKEHARDGHSLLFKKRWLQILTFFKRTLTGLK